MQNSGKLLEKAVSWLQADRENSVDILKGKLSSIIQFSKYFSWEKQRKRKRIDETDSCMSKTRRKIKEMRKEKLWAGQVRSRMIDKYSASPAFQSLSQQRERLEDNIVRFKLLIANVKSEIESFQDLKFQLSSEISCKNSKIQKLVEESHSLKNEKHQLVLKQATRSLSGQFNSNSLSFAKSQIKHIPSSSFQIRLSLDEPDYEASSTPSNWVSSRQSEI